MEPIKKTLLDCLESMDIPKSRREINLGNLMWLKRNLFIRNGENPNYPSALHFINHLLARKDEL